MTDLERVKAFYDWIKAKYEIEEPNAGREGVDCNLCLCVGEKGDHYWAVYLFKDEKLVHWYLTE